MPPVPATRRGYPPTDNRGRSRRSTILTSAVVVLLSTMAQGWSDYWFAFCRPPSRCVANTLLRLVQNTIFDEECIELVPPPALAGGPLPIQPLVCHCEQRVTRLVLTLSIVLKVPTPLPTRYAPQIAPPTNEEGAQGNADELHQPEIIAVFNRHGREIPGVVIVRFLP